MITSHLMNRLFFMALAIVLWAAVSSCAVIGDALDDTNVLGLPIVKDASGKTLGRSPGFSGYSITVYNSKKFFYSLLWNGKFSQNTGQFYYTSTDCSGTKYISNSNEYSVKQIFNFSGTLYVFEGDTIAPVETGLTMNSYYDTSTDTCTASVTTLDGSPIKTISRDKAGIPSTIKGPLTIDDTGN